VSVNAAGEREHRPSIDEVRRRANGADELSSGDVFLAVLAHELRNPLNAILGWVQVLERDRTIAVEPTAVKAIGRNARAMSQILEDLSDHAQLLTGKVHLDRLPVDVGLLIRDAVTAILPGAQARRIHIDLSLSPALPRVLGDPARLMQVLANLLANALKFTPAEGWIRVETRVQEDRAYIVVSDNGCGIDPKLLPYLFDRFRQGEHGHGTRQGLGLGLPLVKAFVEQHGGTVCARSEGPGRGATFIVSLPHAQYVEMV